MRCTWLLALATTLLTSCNTFRVAGAPTFGRVHDIAVADIEAAVAVYRASPPVPGAPVGQIQVISRDEVRIYFQDASGGYTTIKRSHGKWRRTAESVIVTS
jgi:hypothetical protein